MLVASRFRAPCALLLALALSDAAVAGPAAKQPPKFDVVLKPHAVAGAVDQLAVKLRIEGLSVAQGKPVLRMPIVLAGVQSAAPTADAFSAADGKGKLKLIAVDEEGNPSGKYRQYQADRDISGALVVEYVIKPREVNAQTRNGPLFDFRAESGGAIGSGIYFMALPGAADTQYRIKLKWDLSDLPKGARGVWSFGEGTQERTTTADALAYSFYAVGPVESAAKAKDDKFGFYWVSKAPFNMPELATKTAKLYRYMAKYFDDEKAAYAVFARRNPYPAGGGTALYQSFAFGYGPNGEGHSGGGDRLELLAHEIAHNWPKLSDEDHSQTAWYTEGTAEFFSSSLLFQSGVQTLDEFVTLVNGRADAYYSNPLHTLSNEEAGKRFWKETDAQRVPYGKGFMYLAAVDAKLREKSNGAKGVESLVKEVLAKQRSGGKFTVADWRVVIERELGQAGVKDFDDMVAGKEIIPPANSFAPCLSPYQATYRPFLTGFDDLSLGQVRALKADSPAAKAGAQEGDVIVQMEPSFEVAKRDESATMTLKLKRGEQELSVTFLPRMEPVTTWRWKRVPGADIHNCKL